MAENTDDDVARLAAMLSDTAGAWTHEACARRLLEQGVTLPDPPPDPAVVVAEHVWCGVLFRGAEWLPDETTAQANLVAALRHLFTPEALADAAAKAQGVDRDE